MDTGSKNKTEFTPLPKPAKPVTDKPKQPKQPEFKDYSYEIAPEYVIDPEYKE